MKFFYQNKHLLLLWGLLFSILLVSSCSDRGVDYSDKIPPRIVSTYPSSGATDVTVQLDRVEVEFSESIDPDSVNFSVFNISPLVYGSLKVVENKLYFYPFYPLEYDTTYTVKIDTGVTDLFGNHLEKAYTFTFSTEHDTTPPPPPMFYTTHFVTNQSPLIIGGVKQAGSGIKVNGEVYVPIDYTTNFTLQLPLSEGVNTFEVVAYDRAGNVSSPVWLTAILDTTPPAAPEIVYPRRTRDDLVEVYGSKDTDSEVTVTEANSGIQVCRVGMGPALWKCKINFAEEGTRCFEAVAVDEAGNSSQVEEFCITRDITPPSSFSVEATSAGTYFTLFSGSKDEGTYLFVDGKRVEETYSPFDTSEWSAPVSVNTGWNFLNVSLTDDLYNSLHEVYRFFHYTEPPGLIGTYPERGVTFSTPVTGIVLFFDSPVTLSGLCNSTDYIGGENGSNLRVDDVYIDSSKVTLKLSLPLSGVNLDYSINLSCFANWYPRNPSWWTEYPKLATTEDPHLIGLHFDRIENTGYTSAPLPLYSDPVSVTCGFYGCEVTVSPFWADDSLRKEEVIVGASLTPGSAVEEARLFEESRYYLKMEPFACGRVKVGVTNAEGEKFTYETAVSPTVAMLPVTTLTDVNASSFYVKMVTGDWNGDGISDLALSIIKNPDGYRFSPVEVLVFDGVSGGGIDLSTMRVISEDDLGYGIAVSHGAMRDYLLLTRPSEGKLYVYDPDDMQVLSVVELSDKLNVPSTGAGIDITNVEDLASIDNLFFIASDSSTSDNLFLVDGNMDPMFSVYVKGLNSRYALFTRGTFAARGERASTLCVQDYTFDSGRGRILCYYGGDDFPQEYPYFSVTYPAAGYLSWLGYKNELVDLNGDGFDDLVAGLYGDEKLLVYWGGDYPDTFPDMEISYPLKFFMGRFVLGNGNYLLLSNRQTGKMQIMRFENGYEPYSYDVCLNGMALSAWDRLIQLEGGTFLFFRAPSPTSGNVDLFILALPQ